MTGGGGTELNVPVTPVGGLGSCPLPTWRPGGGKTVRNWPELWSQCLSCALSQPLPLPTKARLCPRKEGSPAPWHLTHRAASASCSGVRVSGGRPRLPGAQPPRCKVPACRSGEWSQCEPWRRSAPRPAQIGADGAYQLCVCARKNPETLPACSPPLLLSPSLRKHWI